MRISKILRKSKVGVVGAGVTLVVSAVLALGMGVSNAADATSADYAFQPWTANETLQNPPPLIPGALGRWKIVPPPYPDVPWVKAVPTIEQLTNGKIKTGDVITPEQLPALKPIIGGGWYLEIEDGAKMHIHSTTPAGALVSTTKIKATVANSGKAVISPDGTVKAPDGTPWMGGFPVMNPTNGTEAMVNFSENYADSIFTGNNGPGMWVNPQGQVYRLTAVFVNEYWMNDRTCTAPLGVVPGHETERDRQIIVDTAPYDVRGIGILSIIYDDQSKLPDGYLYLPILRRVQRLSSKQRYDSTDGSDNRAGDINSFSDPLGLWNFKLIARRPMVWPLNPYGAFFSKTPPPGMVKGKYIPYDFEVRDVYEVEAIPKDPAANIYSKKLIYIDSASWQAYGDFYDKGGKLWLSFIPDYGVGSGPCGGGVSGRWYMERNDQTGSSTYGGSEIINAWDDPVRTPLNMFTMNFIITQSR